MQIIIIIIIINDTTKDSILQKRYPIWIITNFNSYFFSFLYICFVTVSSIRTWDEVSNFRLCLYLGQQVKEKGPERLISPLVIFAKKNHISFCKIVRSKNTA